MALTIEQVRTVIGAAKKAPDGTLELGNLITLINDDELMEAYKPFYQDSKFMKNPLPNQINILQHWCDDNLGANYVKVDIEANHPAIATVNLRILNARLSLGRQLPPNSGEAGPGGSL